MNYTTHSAKKQGDLDNGFPLKLDDRTGSGRPAPWKKHKLMNELLSHAYLAVDADKAERLRECGTYLRFKVWDDGTRKLDRLNSCRVRLCPLCSWRRSLKIFHNTNRICMELSKIREFRYIMLTLTVRNCNGEELSGEIDHLFESWNRFMQITAIKRAVKGWQRTLEITHNTDTGSPSFDTYHPHFHVLLCVNKSYFKKEYIRQAAWADFWKTAARLNYDPQVDIRCIKKSTKHGLFDALLDSDVKSSAISSAVAEVSKYAAKPEDYIIPTDWDLTVDAVATLDQALANRRLVAYGGIMREMKRRLQLDDEETGDLINVDQSVDRADVYRLVEYFWFAGARPGDQTGDYKGRYK